MNPTLSSVLFSRWCAGRASARDELISRYTPRLLALIRWRAAQWAESKIDAEDIVQSAWCRFFRSITQGPRACQRSTELFSMLATITLNRLQNKVRYHHQAKRDVNREISLHLLSADQQCEIASREPSPAERVAATQALEHLMLEFQPDDRQILELRLLDYSLVEIADLMHCSEKRIQRRMRIIRQTMDAQAAAGGSNED